MHVLDCEAGEQDLVVTVPQQNVALLQWTYNLNKKCTVVSLIIKSEVSVTWEFSANYCIIFTFKNYTQIPHAKKKKNERKKGRN